MPVTTVEELKDDVSPAVDTVSPDASKASSLTIETKVEQALALNALTGNLALRAHAFKMFLRGKSVTEMVKDINDPAINDEVILAWARAGDWVARGRARNDLRERLVRENVRSQRLAHAEEEVSSSLRLSVKVRRKAEDMLERNDLTPMGLKNIADAAKASGDLGAHGMGDSAVSEGEQTAAAKGKVPLVMIFPAGGLPPVPKDAEVIEVK